MFLPSISNGPRAAITGDTPTSAANIFWLKIASAVRLCVCVDEAIVREYFDGSPCCALGPKKGPCWIRGGREKFVQARQESLDLEKK